jgi:ankyrin repeat protein
MSSPQDIKTTTNPSAGDSSNNTAAQIKKDNRARLFSLAETGQLNELRELIVNSKLEISKLKGRHSQKTPLHVAVLNGHIPVIKHFLNLDLDPNAVDIHKQSVLHYAAHTGDSDVLDLLKKHDVNFNSKDIFGRTALHHAAIQGSVSSVQWLVDNALGRSDTLMTWINHKDMLGSNALHWAAVKGKHDVVKFLVARGINVHLHAGDKQTAANLASAAEKEKVYSWLRDYITHGNSLMTYVRERLHPSSSSSRREEAKNETLEDVRRALSSHVKSFDKWRNEERSTGSFVQFYRNRHGMTALHLAAKYGDFLVASELVHTFHFCVSSKDLYGRTPLHYAALYGNSKIALLLTHLPKGYREEDTYRHFVRGDYTNGLRRVSNNGQGTVEEEDDDFDTDVRVAHWKLKTATDLLPSQMAHHGYQYTVHSIVDLGERLHLSETDHSKSMSDYLVRTLARM